MKIIKIIKSALFLETGDMSSSVVLIQTLQDKKHNTSNHTTCHFIFCWSTDQCVTSDWRPLGHIKHVCRLLWTAQRGWQQKVHQRQENNMNIPQYIQTHICNPHSWGWNFLLMGLEESDIFTLLGNFFCSVTAGAECRSVFGLEGEGSRLKGAGWRVQGGDDRPLTAAELSVKLNCLILTDQHSWSFKIHNWKDMSRGDRQIKSRSSHWVSNFYSSYIGEIHLLQ